LIVFVSRVLTAKLPLFFADLPSSLVHLFAFCFLFCCTYGVSQRSHPALKPMRAGPEAQFVHKIELFCSITAQTMAQTPPREASGASIVTLNGLVDCQHPYSLLLVGVRVSIVYHLYLHIRERLLVSPYSSEDVRKHSVHVAQLLEPKIQTSTVSITTFAACSATLPTPFTPSAPEVTRQPIPRQLILCSFISLTVD